MTTPALSAPPSGKPPRRRRSSVRRFAGGAIRKRDCGRRDRALRPSPLETVLDAGPDEDALLWSPPEGPGFVAVGSVATLRRRPAKNASRRSASAPKHSSRVLHAFSADDAPSPPRCFGGFFVPARRGQRGAVDGVRGRALRLSPLPLRPRGRPRVASAIAARGDEIASDAARRALVATAEALWTRFAPHRGAADAAVRIRGSRGAQRSSSRVGMTSSESRVATARRSDRRANRRWRVREDRHRAAFDALVRRRRSTSSTSSRSSPRRRSTARGSRFASAG